MTLFLTIVHGCQLLITTVTTSLIFDIATFLDSPLYSNILYKSLQVLQILDNLNQEVEGLQAFAFCVVIVTDEHTKPRFKFENGRCAELCLKLRF